MDVDTSNDGSMAVNIFSFLLGGAMMTESSLAAAERPTVLSGAVKVCPILSGFLSSSYSANTGIRLIDVKFPW